MPWAVVRDHPLHPKARVWRVVAKTIHWLNSAFLGRPGLGVAMSSARPALPVASSFLGLGRWVLDWVGWPTGRVAFVESTMAACDAALAALAADREVFLHTSGAHQTIIHSVSVAARSTARYRGRPTVVREVPLGDLDLTSADAVAEEIVARVARYSDGRPAVLVLEHVTYDTGLRLPVDAITARLRERASHVRIVIDGAQAVGLWRPRQTGFSAYLGCLHKYIAAPAATGFVVVDGALADHLPAHVQAMCDVPAAEAGRFLHTVDLEKWSLAERVVRLNHAIGNLDTRLGRVAAFNRVLDATLAPATVSLGIRHDPALRSHISSVDLGSEEAAAHVVASLAAQGYRLQQCGTLVRITAGQGARPQWARDVGRLLRTWIGPGE